MVADVRCNSCAGPLVDGKCPKCSVVYLAFKNEKVAPDDTRMTACSYCRNKAFSIGHDDGQYPFLRCTACQSVLGRIGWAQS